MNADVLATVLTGVVGVLIGVWRIVTVQVDGVRRDLGVQIGDVRRDLTAQNRGRRQQAVGTRSGT